MNRDIWGPKIWFIFHRLSFFSDRTDVIGAWTKMLKELNEIIPCELCKDHMGKYCMENPLRKIVVSGSKGVDIKKAIIQWFYQFHNKVNSDTKKTKFDKDKLYLFYGYGDRVELLADINRTIGEIDKLWTIVPTRGWKESMKHLMGLISGGALD